MCFAFICFAPTFFTILIVHQWYSFFMLSLFWCMCCLSRGLNSVIVSYISSKECLIKHWQMPFQWFTFQYSLNTTTGCINPSIQSIIHLADVIPSDVCMLRWKEREKENKKNQHRLTNLQKCYSTLLHRNRQTIELSICGVDNVDIND